MLDDIYVNLTKAETAYIKLQIKIWFACILVCVTYVAIAAYTAVTGLIVACVFGAVFSFVGILLFGYFILDGLEEGLDKGTYK